MSLVWAVDCPRPGVLLLRKGAGRSPLVVYRALCVGGWVARRVVRRTLLARFSAQRGGVSVAALVPAVPIALYDERVVIFAILQGRAVGLRVCVPSAISLNSINHTL